MPEVPVGYGQAVLSMTYSTDPEPMITTCGFSFVSAGTFEQPDADEFAADFGTFVKACVANIVTVTNVSFVVGLVGGDAAYESSAGNGVGTVSGSSLPQNCAILVKKRTGLVGRKNRGRMFLPGIRENEVDQLGVISSTEVTRLQGHANTFAGNVASSTQFDGLAILHAVGDGTTPALVPNLQVDSRIATQRRRLRR